MIKNPSFDTKKMYPYLLLLRDNDFPQYGDGFYIYKDDNHKYQGNVSKVAATKEDADKNWESHVYVPTRDELEKGCHEVFAEIFELESTKCFSPILAELKISEGRVRFNRDTMTEYTVSYVSNEEIYIGLITLWRNLKYYQKKIESPNLNQKHAVIFFVLGLITALVFYLLSLIKNI